MSKFIGRLLEGEDTRSILLLESVKGHDFVAFLNKARNKTTFSFYVADTGKDWFELIGTSSHSEVRLEIAVSTATGDSNFPVEITLGYYNPNTRDEDEIKEKVRSLEDALKWLKKNFVKFYEKIPEENL